MSKRQRPFVPPELLNDPCALDFYLPLWIWRAWDRERKTRGVTEDMMIRASLAREFDHLRGRARKLVEDPADKYSLTRHGHPPTWAVVIVPAWLRLEMELQTKPDGGKTVVDRVTHGFKLQALGVRMMHQLSLFE